MQRERKWMGNGSLMRVEKEAEKELIKLSIIHILVIFGKYFT